MSIDNWIDIYSDPNLFQIGQTVYVANGNKNLKYFVTKKTSKVVRISRKAKKPRKDSLSLHEYQVNWNN